jgi:hypothetical protein
MNLSHADVEAITALWQFEFFGDLLDSAGFYIHSSNLAYVIDALPRILTADYLPSDSDLLRLHYRTAGIIPYRLSGIPADPHHAQSRSSSSTKKHASTANKGMDFLSDARIVETASMNVRLIDVGGARHERLKWGSQFVDAHKQGKVPATITAILFVVALDSYAFCIFSVQLNMHLFSCLRSILQCVYQDRGGPQRQRDDGFTRLVQIGLQRTVNR